MGVYLWVGKEDNMKKVMEKLEEFLELGGTKKDIVLLAISGVSLILSLTNDNS